jgi:hypothetical protein
MIVGKAVTARPHSKKSLISRRGNRSAKIIIGAEGQFLTDETSHPF